MLFIAGRSIWLCRQPNTNRNSCQLSVHLHPVRPNCTYDTQESNIWHRLVLILRKRYTSSIFLVEAQIRYFRPSWDIWCYPIDDLCFHICCIVAFFVPASLVFGFLDGSQWLNLDLPFASSTYLSCLWMRTSCDWFELEGEVTTRWNGLNLYIAHPFD